MHAQGIRHKSVEASFAPKAATLLAMPGDNEYICAEDVGRRDVLCRLHRRLQREQLRCTRHETAYTFCANMMPLERKANDFTCLARASDARGAKLKPEIPASPNDREPRATASNVLDGHIRLESLVDDRIRVLVHTHPKARSDVIENTAKNSIVQEYPGMAMSSAVLGTYLMDSSGSFMKILCWVSSSTEAGRGTISIVCAWRRSGRCASDNSNRRWIVAHIGVILQTGPISTRRRGGITLPQASAHCV